ncbi:family 16 glycosylhydrolase [Reichenbachiella carrageenanivorans]|uniref:Family 16 glycosylhydrolase n=1 Tax=Reichenbachiella carrageenanivorans TaxID=2979869 RepID=A0ABY6CVF6_9BACT|nr:family 16 glycosylhydrolase [Reichenbachiella carrageenanivorans]UXX77890.1 family 16 glycosylhydrolase [Reichenbachiella carrageenanivorans]
MGNLKAHTIIVLLTLAAVTNTTAQDYPLSDPDNIGKWILNGDFSDEFEGDSLNRSRWHIQGEYIEGCEGDACRDGIYYNNFKGRWPAQFSPDNAWVEDGKLILETRWEPDFDFLDDCDTNNTGYCYGKDLDDNPMPITTAGVNSLKQFTYGYMEICSKAADAEITSSFWTIGNGGEFDMFEMFGKYEPAGRKHKEKELKFNMIEWNTGFEPRFDVFIPTDWRVADDYHVYGFDWDETSMKIYIDGKYIETYTAADFDEGEGTDWFFTKAQRLWVDQECFPWNGLPNEEDLDAQYQIKYIRIWQKEAHIEDVTAPIMSNIDTTLTLNDGEVSITISEQAQLYLVPVGTTANQDAIVSAGNEVTVSYEGRAIVKTYDMTPGHYVLYAIDWAGNVSEASSKFEIESAPDRPVLSLDKKTNAIQIFPNPGNGMVQITGIDTLPDSLSFVNTTGSIFKQAVRYKNQVDVSTLATGLYMIHIPGQAPIKFLKE